MQDIMVNIFLAFVIVWTNLVIFLIFFWSFGPLTQLQMVLGMWSNRNSFTNTFVIK